MTGQAGDSSWEQQQVNEVLACIILYTHFGGDAGIDFARKRGVFAYYLNWNGTERVIEWLITNNSLLNLSKGAETYLFHKYEVRWLSEYYKKCDQKVDLIIEEHERKKRCFTINGVTFESNIVMELLTLLELLFRKSIEQRESYKAAAVEIRKEISYDVPDYYSMEELCEAVSYVVSRYHDLYNNNGRPIWLDVDMIKNDTNLVVLVLTAAKKKLVSEWEVDIDYYGYDIEQDESVEHKSALYRIIDKNDLEKSKQLGLIKTDLQGQARGFENIISQKECVYLCKLAKEIRTCQDLIFELVDRGTELERYRMKLYSPLLERFIPKDYNRPAFFVEEIAQIDEAAHEMLMSTNELLDYEVSDLCTVKDVILFKRFFTFVSYAQQVFIEEHSEDLETIAKSIVPSFRKEQLLQLLELFVDNKRKAEKLLELYCWDGDGFLDIQSTPIIKMNISQYLLVPFVLSTSNLIRNVIVKERKKQLQKTNSNGTEEPLEKYASEIFDYQRKVFSYKSGKKFKFNGRSGEVDLVVWSEKHLYLIECKNSILPTSSFELRTTYDYIRKAENQLDLSSAALEDAAFKKQILNNWGVPCRDYIIHTLILLGNRIFTAPNGFRHQIRYVHELNTILNSGVINSNFGKWQYWKKEEFSEEDFIRFISENDPISNDFLEAMSPFKLVVSCAGKRIERLSYSLNLLKHLELDDKNLVNLSTEEHMLLRADHEKKHDEIIKEIKKSYGKEKVHRKKR